MEPKPKDEQLKQLPLRGFVSEEKSPVIGQEQSQRSSKVDSEEAYEEELRNLLKQLDDPMRINQKRTYEHIYAGYHNGKVREFGSVKKGNVTTSERIQIARFVLGGQKPEDKPRILMTEAEKKARDTEIRVESWKKSIDGDDK